MNMQARNVRNVQVLGIDAGGTMTVKRDGNTLRIVSRGMAIALAALSLMGSAVAAPVETVLYSFTGGSDGAGPIADLIADKEGALYGTTQNGGTGNNGTVFKLTPPAKGCLLYTSDAADDE